MVACHIADLQIGRHFGAGVVKVLSRLPARNASLAILSVSGTYLLALS